MKDVVTSSQRRADYERRGLWNDETLVQQLMTHAEERPDATAVIDGTDGRAVTYEQLLDDARRIAGFFGERGLSLGDVVSVQLPNRYETVAVDVAVLLVGGVLNPLLPNYREHELRGIMEHAGTRLLVTPDEHHGFDFVPMGRSLCELFGAAHLVVGRARQDGSATLLADVLARPVPDTISKGARGAHEVSEVIFTSGTESRPKAVMHTEQTTSAAVRMARDTLGLRDGDTVWMPSPIGHSTGLNYGVRLALHLGLPLVLQDRWDAEDALRLVVDHNCNYTLAATTFLADLVRLAAERDVDLSSLRLFGCGGSPVPAELVRRAAEVGVAVQRLYGSTEALVVTWNRPSSPADKRESTDGPPVEGMELSLRDDDGTAVAPGEPGELWIRGPSGSVGYFDDPVRTAATFSDDGWIQSGDIGVVDAEGYLSIVGRKKEIIIRGGLNIAPREIEDLISEMPGVQSVAIVGVQDDRLGEKLCACIVPSAGMEAVGFDEMVAFLQDRNLATYKLPQRVELFEQLPRTASGKIQKGLLLELVNERVG